MKKRENGENSFLEGAEIGHEGQLEHLEHWLSCHGTILEILPKHLNRLNCVKSLNEAMWSPFSFIYSGVQKLNYLTVDFVYGDTKLQISQYLVSIER